MFRNLQADERADQLKGRKLDRIYRNLRTGAAPFDL